MEDQTDIGSHIALLKKPAKFACTFSAEIYTVNVRIFIQRCFCQHIKVSGIIFGFLFINNTYLFAFARNNISESADTLTVDS